ncbi:element excision factor XisH family protein [Nostoc sp. 'Peltigera malacea cyanobiont' DB3992]|uniref:element excision factor XisH family protein n=1 Tax=Nostoc sp. 'Peltigera malacea cyanobiont' DB3992 TaxID=1206980 RepID=UPI000C043330|nr:hypothetical protein CK516_12070 [Nostoc sp. 'Peltigera malacea cyanobiont' DB3992]
MRLTVIYIEWQLFLYLAVPLNTYNDFLNKLFIKTIIQRSQINLIVYDVETQEIIRWQI